MIVERVNDELVVRLSSFVKFEEIQRMLDLLAYKEATARSVATQAMVDNIAKEANRGWWAKNRSRFVK